MCTVVEFGAIGLFRAFKSFLQRCCIDTKSGSLAYDNEIEAISTVSERERWSNACSSRADASACTRSADKWFDNALSEPLNLPVRLTTVHSRERR